MRIRSYWRARAPSASRSEYSFMMLPMPGRSPLAIRRTVRSAVSAPAGAGEVNASTIGTITKGADAAQHQSMRTDDIGMALEPIAACPEISVLPQHPAVAGDRMAGSIEPALR